MTIRAKILSAGMAVPDRRVTNKDLEQWMDTTDEWIRQRSGIVERRWVSDGETPADLAEAASRQALERAGLEPTDLDCIIVPTLSAQHDFPGTSFFLQDRLGTGTAPAFDLRAQCSGFLYSLSVARSFVASGQYERVLVCGAEVHSTGLDVSTAGRDVTVLFGDGAGAVIVAANDDPEDRSEILPVSLGAEGKYAKKLWTEAPGSALPGRIDQEILDRRGHFPVMEGKFVFKHAVTRMPEVLNQTLDENGVKKADVDHFFFHQANLRINEYVANSLEIPGTKVHSNIQRYGNCSAASIPILLAEAQDDDALERGQLLSMTGFGSGFSWASALVRW